MALRDWIDIDSLRVLSHHLSGNAAAIVSFILVDNLVKWGLSDSTVKAILESIENFVLVGLIVWFAVQMAVILWKNRAWKGGIHGPNASILVA